MNFRHFALFIYSIAFILPLKAQVDPQNVTIARDKWGVPHIFGHTDAETAYGLAWANAEDNFEDMQRNMLMCKAQLGKVDGKEGAMIDFAVQLMQARKVVAERYDTDISPEFKKVLQGYVQAVNHYAETHPDEVLVKGTFPVTEQEVVMGYVMSFALITGAPAHMINILQGNAGAPTPYSLRGSNGLAVKSNKTSTGETFLANNSHQPLNGPTAWYEAHIVSDEGLNTLGGLFPAGTSVFAGCNPNIAWMHTVNFPDLVDVYELTMHEKHKNQYKFDGEWKTLEQYKAKLRVKMGPIVLPISKKYWNSVYGPTLRSKGKYYSLRFGALHNIKAAEQWHRMCKAQNFTQFKAAIEMQGFPGLNIIYADRHDTIYYTDNGLIPIRNPKYDWLGLVPGNTSATLWTEFHPLSDEIQVLNPPSGYVFNTNQSPYISTSPQDCPKPSDYDPTMGYMKFNNNRGIRMQDQMEEEWLIDYEKFKEIKYDRRYPDSIYIYYIENINEIFELSPQDYPDISLGIEILKSWDRNTDPENEGASLMLLVNEYLWEHAMKAHIAFERHHWNRQLFVNAIDYAQDHLMKHFGTVNVPLGDLQRHVRGKKDWPIGGGPDVLAATYSKKWKKGQRVAFLGDSYIQLVRFGDDGIHIETVNCFGSSNHEDSPHYDDQVPLFLNQQLKPMTLDKETIMREAEKVYHPE